MNVTSGQPEPSVTLKLLQAPEEMQKRLPETAIHEAVRDGIAATGRIRQQLKETNRGVSQIIVNDGRIEQDKSVDGVERRPADEELQDYGKEHFDDAFLVQETAFGVGATQTWAVLSRVWRCLTGRTVGPVLAEISPRRLLARGGTAAPSGGAAALVVYVDFHYAVND